MTGTRPKALEKAKQRAEEQRLRRAESSPASPGFESERAKAKQALRSELNAYNGQNVQKIAAHTEAAQEDRILRVAAYCRVSTDDIWAFIAQMRLFT